MSASILYGCWRSSASHRLQIGLRLKQIGFEYRPVSLDKGEQCSDWYRAINPRAEVPAMVIDGKVWTQSLAILESLDELYKEQGCQLLPNSPDQRRLCRAIAEQVNSSMQPLLVPARLRKPIINSAPSQLRSELATTIQQGVRLSQTTALSTLDQWLQQIGSAAFCVGEQPTLADVLLIPHLDAIQRLGLSLENYKRLEQIYKNCSTVLAFTEAQPLGQIDAPGFKSS